MNLREELEKDAIKIRAKYDNKLQRMSVEFEKDLRNLEAKYNNKIQKEKSVNHE